MEHITKADLVLINNLSSRTYTDNKLLSNASEQEKAQLKKIKKKLKDLSKYFAQKYEETYGPFETSIATGNDIAIGGIKFKRIWSGIFKGAENKQYASQVSFVMDPVESCLNVGFYFGRASGHSRNKEERTRLGKQLKDLGISLSNTIKENKQFREKYFDLFEYGFTAYSGGEKVTNHEWIEDIKEKTKSSQIIVKIYPNDFDIIENSTIDSFVSQVIFLMGGILNKDSNSTPLIKPLTPEQRAKQAQRLAEIGNKGELFIMGKELEKIENLGLNDSDYPKHVALESTTYGYDILSINENNEEIYIEVKTTTRSKKDVNSKQFFISMNEWNVYNNNKSKFKLYRVYDIENSPSYEELNLEIVQKISDGYICKY